MIPPSNKQHLPRVVAMGFGREEVLGSLSSGRWSAFRELLAAEFNQEIVFDCWGHKGELDGEVAGPMDALRSSEGALVMPTRPPHRLTSEDLSGVGREYAVGTISVGSNHIVPPPDREDIQVFYCDSGDCNAPEVVEMTVAFAVSLLRQIPEAARAAVGLGRPGTGFNNRDFRETESMDGKIWLALGTGRQIQLLLPRLAVAGIAEFLVFSPRKSPPTIKDFDSVCQRLPSECLGAIIEEPLGLVRDVTLLTGCPIRVRMFSGKEALGKEMSRAGVVSVHLPYEEKESSRYVTTAGLLDASLLSRLAASAVLINVARGGIVDEEALVGLLLGRKLRGYATDVLVRESEVFKNGANVLGISPVLDLAMQQAESHCANQSSARIIITPHITGTSLQAFERISNLVVRQVLKHVLTRQHTREKSGGLARA